MRKIITSTIAGAASLLFANTAIATSVGEASISLRGGMTITLLEAGRKLICAAGRFDGTRWRIG